MQLHWDGCGPRGRPQLSAVAFRRPLTSWTDYLEFMNFTVQIPFNWLYQIRYFCHTFKLWGFCKIDGKVCHHSKIGSPMLCLSWLIANSMKCWPRRENSIFLYFSARLLIDEKVQLSEVVGSCFSQLFPYPSSADGWLFKFRSEDCVRQNSQPHGSGLRYRTVLDSIRFRGHRLCQYLLRARPRLARRRALLRYSHDWHGRRDHLPTKARAYGRGLSLLSVWLFINLHILFPSILFLYCVFYFSDEWELSCSANFLIFLLRCGQRTEGYYLNQVSRFFRMSCDRKVAGSFYFAVPTSSIIR